MVSNGSSARQNTGWLREITAALLAGAVVAGTVLWSQALVDDSRSDREQAAAVIMALEADRRENLRFVRERSSEEMKAVQDGVESWVALPDNPDDQPWRPFQGIDLSGQNLSGLRIPFATLRGADLSGAVLIGIDLHDADLSGAKLMGADLTGADLSKTNMRDADLSHASLSKASLIGTMFHGSKLDGADLSGAAVLGTNLSGVDLSSSNLSDVLFGDVQGIPTIYDEFTIWPNGINPPKR